MNEKIESFDEVKQRVVGWVEWGLVGSGLAFERNPANTTLSIAYTYMDKKKMDEKNIVYAIHCIYGIICVQSII